MFYVVSCFEPTFDQNVSQVKLFGLCRHFDRFTFISNWSTTPQISKKFLTGGIQERLSKPPTPFPPVTMSANTVFKTAKVKD